MNVLYRVLNVTVMQHATILMDRFNVHVTMDFQEMEQCAQVQKYTNIIKLLNVLFELPKFLVIISWITSHS